MKLNVVLLALLFTAGVFAQNEGAATTKQDVTIADAQKAYVAGNWKEAADAFEKVCVNEPAEKQVSCNLWGILALSQIGDAKSFKKAGVKLDSLINTTSPRHDNYADLIMTRAQFMLYLGKYDKAAEDLIHAIETSRASQNLVLQKVCTAVLSRTKSEDLSERCESLKHPEDLRLEAASSASSAPKDTIAAAPTPKSSSATAVAPAPKSSSATAAVADASPAPAATAVKSPAEEAKPAEEYWVLQLGAFGVKANANLLVTSLKKQKIQSTIVEFPREDRTLYLVQSGHFATREEANSYGEKVFLPLNVEFQPLLKK